MTDDRHDRLAGADPLELAEAVAAGRLPVSAAEETLRSAHADDSHAAEAAVAELHELTGAIRGVREHAAAFRDAAEPAPVAAPRTTDDVTPAWPIERGGVRLRKAGSPHRSSPAVPVVLAAAAVIVAAVALVGPRLLTQSVASSPSPSTLANAIATPPAIGTPGPSGTAGPLPTASPAPSLSDGIPPIGTYPLSGAPRIATWQLTAPDRISIDTWNAADGSSTHLLDADVWADPEAGVVNDRTVVLAPDGKRVVVLEQQRLGGQARTRVFDLAGNVVWSRDGVATVAWSADGLELAVAYQPGPWIVLIFQADGTASPTTYVRTQDVPLGLLGFAGDGSHLYGWDTNGEADPWNGQPYVLDLARGMVTRLMSFPGGPAGLSPSNVSTPAGLVDAVTGTVLGHGDPAGKDRNWTTHRGSTSSVLPVTLTTGAGATGVAWDATGSLVAVEPGPVRGPDGTQGAELGIVVLAGPHGSSAQTTFSVGPGRYTGRLLGTRAGYTLVGLANLPAHPFEWLGYSELLLVEMATGRAAVLPGPPSDAWALHFAGFGN